MRKDRENWSDLARDALSGYAVIVLAIVCFILGLAVFMAIIRMLIGLGQA